MRKSGAMELSIGTIVIIVLAMSMLILGLVLIKNIFGGATDITDMTLDQLRNQVSGMFGSNKELVMYPDTLHIDVKGGELSGFGFGVKNILEGAQAGTEFRYEVIVADNFIEDKCGVTEEEAVDWINLGGTGGSGDLSIASGKFEAVKVTFEVPDGAKLCTFRYKVKVYDDNDQIYDEDIMDVTIRA